MSANKITIIGCGLIGGSIALALRRWPNDHLVACLDLPERLAAVRDAGVADEIGTMEELALHVPASSVVLVATPVHAIPGILSRLRPWLREGAIVTDTGSTKKPIMAEARGLMPSGTCFIGGHPMAGSENSGVAAADPLLFRDRPYLLCPYPDTPPEKLLALIGLAEKLGALPLTIEAEEHDRMMAVISHLPQVISVALMHAAEAEDAGHGILDRLAGRGFLDMTRLAASDYRVWNGILEMNREALQSALDRFSTSLAVVARAVQSGEAEFIWEQTGRSRRRMGPESAGRGRKPDLRGTIDLCDKQLLGVLARRMQAARRIGKLKKSHAAPVRDPERERRLIALRREWGKSLGLPQELVDELYAAILGHSARIQEAGQ